MTQLGNFFLQCYFEQHLLYFLTTEYQFITLGLTQSPMMQLTKSNEKIWTNSLLKNTVH